MAEIGGASDKARRPALRAYVLLLAFLALRAFGNLLLAWGTKQLPQGLSANVTAYVLALLNPYVSLAIGMLILALLVRMALLSVADLSFVLPMTAVGYVIAAVFGKIFLHEEVSPQRWAGVILIFAGAALVGSTSETTTKNAEGIR